MLRPFAENLRRSRSAPAQRRPGKRAFVGHIARQAGFVFKLLQNLRGTDSFDSFSGTTPEPLWTVLEIGASARQEGVSEKLLSKHVQIWFLWPSRGLRGSDASFSASQATPSRVVVDGLASLRAGM